MNQPPADPKSEEQSHAYPKATISDFLKLKPELIGFQMAFLAMLVFPLVTFFLMKALLSSIGVSENKINIYSLISSVVVVWLIMVSYSIYYVKDDIKAVFTGKKDHKE